MTDAAHVLDLARRRGLMFATAESCTGGLIAGRLTDVPGSSDAFDRGFVTYSNAAKSEMLGVPFWLIERHGAVSEDVARAMAGGALTHSQASLAVSVTGVAEAPGVRHSVSAQIAAVCVIVVPYRRLTTEAEDVGRTLIVMRLPRSGEGVSAPWKPAHRALHGALVALDELCVCDPQMVDRGAPSCE